MSILRTVTRQAAVLLTSFLLPGFTVCEQLEAQPEAIEACLGQRKAEDGTALGEEIGGALRHPIASQQNVRKDAGWFVLKTESGYRSGYVKASDSKRQTCVLQLFLTADISNVSLKRVLTRLGREIGATIYMADGVLADLEEEISVAFERLPVKEGIQRLLEDQNYIVVQEKSPALIANGRREASTESIVTKIYILPHQAAGPSTRQQPFGPQVTNIAGGEEQQEEVWAAAKRAVEATQQEEDRFGALERLFIGADPSQRATTIEAALTDSDPDVRTYTLGMIESADRVSIETLAELSLGDESPDVRMHALETLLSAHGPAAAIPTLERTLADPDPSVKALAQQMLELALTMQGD